MRRASNIVLVVALGLFGSACTDAGEPAGERALDTRLEAHAVLASKPTAEGHRYVQAVAEAHREADRLERSAAIERLLAALEQQPPPDDGAAELLHYDLLARTAELMLEASAAERALALLEPHMDPATSLPIDRAAARGLIALGDAAAQTGDHRLAMGSYARALEMLSLLLEEVES